MQRRAFVKGLAAATASVQIWPELAHGAIKERLFDDYNMTVKHAQGTYAYATDPAAKAKREDYNCLRFSTHIHNSEYDVDLLATHIEDLLA